MDKARIDLLQVRRLGPLLRSRWPQLLIRLVMLGGFIFTILASFLGTPVGGRNFAIIAVWIAWWTVLKLLLIPFGGRAWCSICPIPLPGEWLQQGGVFRAGRRRLGLNLRWPARLRHGWLQLLGFAGMGLFSAVILTQPLVTGGALLLLLVGATGLALIFERRAFCRYLCPMGGYIGSYAGLAPVEVRVKDRKLCATCADKPCYKGNREDTAGCPWGLFPSAVNQNAACGLCLECLRACPKDNMTINLRPFGTDLAVPVARRLDDAWLGLFLLACAPVYSAVMLGPWGGLKMAAAGLGSVAWIFYALVFLTLTLGVVPGAAALAVWIGRRWSRAQAGWRELFTTQAAALAPLGLGAWVAFTLSFAFGKLAYLWPVLSDPFGWGWNLFGTANWPWVPYLTTITPALQALVLVGGLIWGAYWSRRLAEREASPAAAMRLTLPVWLFGLIYILAMAWLLI